MSFTSQTVCTGLGIPSGAGVGPGYVVVFCPDLTPHGKEVWRLCPETLVFVKNTPFRQEFQTANGNMSPCLCPDFISQRDSIHGCEIKSGRRPSALPYCKRRKARRGTGNVASFPGSRSREREPGNEATVRQAGLQGLG